MKENRQLKFRVWDGSPSFSLPKKMYYNAIVGRGVVIATVDEEEFEDDNLEPGYMTMDNSKAGFIVMQSTGLQDKNRKDIYDGDILLGDFTVNDNDQPKYIVSFVKGGFRIVLFDTPNFEDDENCEIASFSIGQLQYLIDHAIIEEMDINGTWLDLAMRLHEDGPLYTVIGNIYQHPNLLTPSTPNQ